MHLIRVQENPEMRFPEACGACGTKVGPVTKRPRKIFVPYNIHPDDPRHGTARPKFCDRCAEEINANMKSATKQKHIKGRDIRPNDRIIFDGVEFVALKVEPDEEPGFVYCTGFAGRTYRIGQFENVTLIELDL